MNKDFIVLLLLILLAHRLLERVLSERQKVEAFQELSRMEIADMKNELQQFLIKLQDDSGGPGISADQTDSKYAQASFQPGRTDLSKYFAEKSQAAIGELPTSLEKLVPDNNMPKDEMSGLPGYKAPAVGGELYNNVNIGTYQNEKMMNGGQAFFNNVQPNTAGDSMYAALQ